MVNRLTIAMVAVLASVFSMDALAAFGRTAGTFAVSPKGSAQYTIPIWTPPGVRGVQPNLALVYDSQSSYGLMGPGWILSGLSTISRCNRTYAQDGTPAPVTLTYADAFCLDGNRLRLTSSEVLSTYGQAGTTYQTEIANFSNVIASSTLAGNGPSYFTVKGKNGWTYEYGNTTDSKFLPAVGAATPYAWALDKVTDRAGSTMTITYDPTKSYVPLNINYTAPSGSTSFPYQVTFGYSTLQSAANIISKYIAGNLIQQTQQLSSITATSSGTTVRKYNLTYTTSSATLRATLTSIQECGGSAGTDCLPATSVGYQYGTAGVAYPTTATGSGANIGTVYSADIDGDGQQDLIFATANGNNFDWWVQLATKNNLGSGYGTPIPTSASTTSTPTILIGDFATTGHNEILAVANNT